MAHFMTLNMINQVYKVIVNWLKHKLGKAMKKKRLKEIIHFGLVILL